MLTLYSNILYCVFYFWQLECFLFQISPKPGQQRNVFKLVKINKLEHKTKAVKSKFKILTTKLVSFSAKGQINLNEYNQVSFITTILNLIYLNDCAMYVLACNVLIHCLQSGMLQIFSLSIDIVSNHCR